MTSEDLFDAQRDFTSRAAFRLLTVGADQYDMGGVQKFEGMPLRQLFDEFEEELQDIVNYATMLSIRLRRIRDGVL